MHNVLVIQDRSMKISVIIPSFNQGQFIGETIESILSHHRQEIELIVIDGGSADETLSVLHAFSHKIAYLGSEPDRGQTHAINKGLRRMTGEIWCYQNSDDLVLPGTFDIVAQAFEDAVCHWLSGSAQVTGSPFGQNELVPCKPIRLEDYLLPWLRAEKYVFPFSGACFMSRSLFEEAGFFDESYNFSMDMEYYCRARLKYGYDQMIIPDQLAVWRWHGESKTMTKGIAYGFREDEIAIAEKYLPYAAPERPKVVYKTIEREKSAVAARKALYQHRTGGRRNAKETLLSEIRRRPKSLTSRQFLGAIRRVYAPKFLTAGAGLP
jgi:glycosyltransferase involved in cell wall biosynthesis